MCVLNAVIGVASSIQSGLEQVRRRRGGLDTQYNIMLISDDFTSNAAAAAAAAVMIAAPAAQRFQHHIIYVCTVKYRDASTDSLG